MTAIMPWIICTLAYLLGSISFAWWVARAKGINLREHGSGNLGATNVGRVLGGRYFALVFFADFAKGFIPVLLMQQWLSWSLGPETNSASSWWQVGAGAAAVIGHIFPCWHRFKGGKAVATSLGVIIGISPVVAAVAFGTWVLAWAVGRLGSLKSSAAVGPASIVAAISAIVAQWYWYAITPPYAANTTLVTLAGALILIRHRSNLRNLFTRRQYHTPSDTDSAKPEQKPSQST